MNKIIEQKICESPECRTIYTPQPHVGNRQRFCSKCSPTRGRNKIHMTLCCKNCSKDFEPVRARVKTQKFCCTICREDYRHSKAKNRGSVNVRKQMVKARCPKCRRVHDVNMEWDQNIMPWIFCTSCSEYRRLNSSVLEADHGHRVNI